MLARIGTGLPSCWTGFKGDICIWDFVNVFAGVRPMGFVGVVLSLGRIFVFGCLFFLFALPLPRL